MTYLILATSALIALGLGLMKPVLGKGLIFCLSLWLVNLYQQSKGEGVKNFLPPIEGWVGTLLSPVEMLSGLLPTASLILRLMGNLSLGQGLMITALYSQNLFIQLIVISYESFVVMLHSYLFFKILALSSRQ